ncbi:hypothetical protein SLEP1_g45839 [Rubroshorea leprosula]|uniref:Uncharacterized protein n=1 Tax=Rubroshorea leprosula TaxID=152421 RepID=A0AAV5LMN4_9ROSI|nr:hypothetical protein SLEP1_g45839 [Rubroshorea leprosula]
MLNQFLGRYKNFNIPFIIGENEVSEDRADLLGIYAGAFTQLGLCLNFNIFEILIVCN